MQLVIQERACWMCGSEHNVTTHHALPKYLKPKSNVLIPLCDKCHKKLHGQDLNTATALLFKTNKILETGMQSLRVVGDIVKRKKTNINKVTVGDVLCQKNKKKQ